VCQGLRNRHNHLSKAGDAKFELLHGGEEARKTVADAIDLKRQWLVQRGAISSAFVDASSRDCLLALAADRTGTGAMVARLTVNGEPAAIRFGFEYKGTHFSYMSAYDQAFSHLSPGKLLMEYCIEGCWERGVTRLDMLPPDGRHKTDWCDDRMPVADYTLPLTWRGRAYAELYQERVRPALRRGFQHLPTGVRSLLATLFISI
jgi:CelD/BcsL family acetyltransferase involved in cellulose biosynthesis